MTATETLARPRQFDPADRLFRHSMRPEWGVGLWVREERTRRRIRFKDGRLRAFKKGFYHLLRPVDVNKVDVDEVFEEIAGQHELLALEEMKASARLENPPVMSLEEQIQFFRSEYEGGFPGEAFREAHRSPTTSNRTKKAHTAVASKLAQELLSKSAMDALLKEERYDDLHAAAVKVLSKTSLVSLSSAVRPIKALDEGQRKIFVESLYTLLHGQERFNKRFGNWLRTLRGDCDLTVNWATATIFPALVFPKRHICAKQKVFDLQARTVRPGTAILGHPTQAGYRRVQQVTRAVHKILTDAGMKPADNLDVRTFIWQTLRPKAQQLVNAEKKAR